MTWKWIGGGCALLCRANYPCDDQYKHSETGEKRTVHSTWQRHFEMPTEVHELQELFALDGVKQDWEQNEDLSLPRFDDRELK